MQSTLSILLVEDHVYIRRMLSERLALAQYEVAAAATADEALALFRTRSIDLILTDLHLAGPSGFALAAAIRRNGGKGATIPILAMTAGPSAEEEQRCRAAGITMLLLKPFTLEAFTEAADRLCRPEPPTPALSTQALSKAR